MALSPNYGWAEPDNSSLVKNGASDIRTLGDAIDTSVWNVGFGQAGKNKVINGDFRINQRAFTSTTVAGTYGFDRWLFASGDGTVTYSAQTFTPGAAPVAGYEAINFARLVSTGQTLTSAQSRFRHFIEDVRTFANQTITVSFWAKADTGTPNVAINLAQVFGSGGSTAVSSAGQKFAITTSWVRYSKTFSIPSISGKTIGTSSYLSLNIWTSAGSDRNTDTDSMGIQSATIDIWGVQVEAGSKATPFQTATGTLQGELAACQRYYWRSTGGSAYSGYGTGFATLTTEAIFTIKFPTTMRIEPTSMDYANLGVDFYNVGNTAITALTLNSAISGMDWARIIATVASGLTQYRSYDIANANNANGYLGFSAEL